jgi:hypothetical protein
MATIVAARLHAPVRLPYISNATFSHITNYNAITCLVAPRSKGRGVAQTCGLCGHDGNAGTGAGLPQEFPRMHAGTRIIFDASYTHRLRPEAGGHTLRCIVHHDAQVAALNVCLARKASLAPKRRAKAPSAERSRRVSQQRVTGNSSGMTHEPTSASCGLNGSSLAIATFRRKIRFFRRCVDAFVLLGVGGIILGVLWNLRTEATSKAGNTK